MPRPVSNYPTQLELQILKILWKQEPVLARDVLAELAKSGKKLARTSVITTLNTMVGKRFLSRKKQGNTFLFSPKITEKQVEERVLGDVVDRVFNGSASAVMLKLFDVKGLNPEELGALRKLIDQKLNPES